MFRQPIDLADKGPVLDGRFMADETRASPVEIVSASADQFLPLAAVASSAFAGLPIYRWFVGGGVGRAGFLDSMIRHGIDHGEVHATADLSAVAVWFRHDGEVPSVAVPQWESAAAVGDCPDRLKAFLAGIRDGRPRGPHRFLGLLAVAPDRQGRGVGSALMCHQHAYLDRLRLGAHVMAGDRGSRRFFLHHGYRAFGDPLSTGRDAPPIYPMWRDDNPIDPRPSL